MIKLSKEQVFQVLIWLRSRVITALVLMILASCLFIDYAKINRTAKIKFLNDFRPSLDYLVDFQEQKVELNRQIFKDSVFYFKKANEIILNRPDIFGLLAYCHYYLGEKKEAIENFEIANNMYKKNFWFHYNLGIIYTREGNYQKANYYLERAINLSPHTTLQFIAISKAYLQIFHRIPDPRSVILQHLKTGYRDAHALLLHNYYQQKDYRRAFDVTKKAIRDDLEDLGFFYYYIGRMGYEQKRYESALKALTTSARLDSENVHVYEYLLKTLAAMGQEDKAVSIRTKYNNLRALGPAPFDPTKDITLKIF